MVEREIEIKGLQIKEKMKNYNKWDYSIRVNKSYRIIFNIVWAEIKIIEITDLNNHYN